MVEPLSLHQAVAQAQAYIAEGREWVVDIDLEKFFDRFNHDMLMARLARKVADKRLLKIIRAFLNAGVMENGLASLTEEGTPQGGPLSPLLSNIVLDDLDQELEARGHAFVRYADDCDIYVRSERAGQRVMEGVTDFITRKLKLKVNQTKSAVDRPSKRKFLGFWFTPGKEPKRRIAPKAQAGEPATTNEATLTVCPADFNCNGIVNSGDFFDFLVAFFSNNADLNKDGTTTSQGFFDFVTAFLVAAPSADFNHDR